MGPPVSRGLRGGVDGGRTGLAHALEVDVDAALVLAEGCVAGLVVCNPVADVAAELAVVGRGAVQLVGERAEQAVAVSEGRGGIETEGAELLGQQLVVLCWIAVGGLYARGAM